MKKYLIKANTLIANRSSVSAVSFAELYKASNSIKQKDLVVTKIFFNDN